MIYELSGRHLFGGLNHNKMRDISRGFDMRQCMIFVGRGKVLVGGLRRERYRLGFFIGGPGVCTGKLNILLSIDMEVSAHGFVCVD